MARHDSQRQQLDKRWEALKLERSSWWQHWSELSAYLLPRAGRYFTSDRDKGWPRQNGIFDNSATKALRILSAGMMSGMTSPSRPWFRLETADAGLMAAQPVKIWLHAVTERIETAFARANVYRVLPMLYEELGAFGTAAALIANHPQRIIHLHPFTVGEYAIATDWAGNVNTLFREFDKTVGEIVGEFGLAQCSPTVQSLYARGELDAWVTVRHGVEPRQGADCGKLDALQMPWKSIYWEAGCGDGRLLRASGFRTFPCVAPRWAARGGDIYGNSPGMEALGDIKQLQLQQLRKSQAIDYQTNPPLQVPYAMKNREIEIFPGGISYYDAAAAEGGIRNAFQVQLDLRGLLEDMQDIRTRINAAFYADLFLMISEQPADGSMTATEVAARQQEKMLMLGPVVERLIHELLAPLVETTFERLLALGLLPPPPPELQGRDLHVEFISILAQAQKAASLNGIDKFVTALGQVAQLKPEVLDKFNADQWADEYGDKTGVDPQLIVAGPQLALIRAQRARQLQAERNGAALQQGAEIAGKAGGVALTPDTLAGALAQRSGLA